MKYYPSGSRATSPQHEHGEFQGMLLWRSRADLEVGSDGLVGLASDVALEAADDVLCGFLFGCASGSVGAGGVVVS